MIDSTIVDSLVAGAGPRRTARPLDRPDGARAGGPRRDRPGKSNSAIADALVLAKRAVEKHINAIFMKLGLAQADDVSKRVKATLMFLAQSDGD